VHRALGRALHRLGRREEGVVEYGRSLALDEGSADVHNDLGVLLAQLGRIPEAIQHFERAVQLAPEDAAVRENLERARGMLRR
jgi:superkiller protein 3